MDLSKIITCGHCSNIAPMKKLGYVFDDQQEPNEFGPGPEQGYCYDVLICPACRKENIVKYFWSDLMESENDTNYITLYPIIKDMPLGLPDEIKGTFQAAEKVKTIDVNAYAILMRRLLEQVCLDRKAKKGNLAAMLKDLSDKGEIPSKLVDVARGLKNFGNIGAHAGSGNLSPKEIPIVNALTKAILEYIYGAPYLAALAEEKLNNIKNKN